MKTEEKEILAQLLKDERINLDGMCEEDKAYLARRVRRLANARRPDNARGVLKMWIYIFILSTFATWMLDSRESDGKPVDWSVTPNVAYMESGSPVETALIEEAIEYVVWSWNSRIPTLDMKYVGLTLGPIESAIITYRWLGPFQHFELTESFSAKGVEQTWIYIDNGLIARSLISMNTGYFEKDFGNCELMTFAHELGHAIGGIGHSANPNDLMYWAPAHCRPTPTDSDVRYLGYTPATCHTEMLNNYDLFIPEIYGKEAFLKYEGGMIWSLEYLNDKLPRSCSVSEYSAAQGELRLTNVKGQYEAYSATFKAVGEDKFKLIYAE